MKPDVAGENGPRLTTVESFDMVKIGKRSVDDMIAKVQEWFEAMSGILSHQEAAKR